MGIAVFLKEYIAWHYGGGISDLIWVWKNFIWFGYNLFSVRALLKTLLSPFYRIRDSYKGWSSVEGLLETFVGNVVSRAVGLVLRVFVITLGLVFEAAVAVSLVPALVVWLLLPALIPLLFLLGFSYIILEL
jgi:hypothetical protein